MKNRLWMMLCVCLVGCDNAKPTEQEFRDYAKIEITYEDKSYSEVWKDEKQSTSILGLDMQRSNSETYPYKCDVRILRLYEGRYQRDKKITERAIMVLGWNKKTRLVEHIEERIID